MSGEKRYLVLENGRVFEGVGFGAPGDVSGELVFTTGMTGYLETLTDPSYHGQIVVQTFPLIGNYGVIPADFESIKVHPKAYIVRQWCQHPSNFRSEGDLDTFFMRCSLPALCGIDTRELVKIIREHGVMNAKLVSSKERLDPSDLQGALLEGAVAAVTPKAAFTERPQETKYRVVLWDFGAKANIARELLRRGCEVVHVPAGASAADILALRPEGVVLSNGPGDPAENTGTIRELQKLCEHKLPMMGICLGHQLLALSRGAGTEKLKYGHRGANQPVKDLQSGRVYITSQNHGYAVQNDTLPKGAKLWFCNANDGTCEGILYQDIPAFSVQYHPEAASGPLDTGFLFDAFIKRLEVK